ncbi:MAG: hypothetical protein EOP88_07960, partial [Verrucomicrobiaceae bacterium]
MKPFSNHRRTACTIAAISAAFGLAAHAQEVTVDGTRDAFGPEGYTLLHTQTTATNWIEGSQQSLANIYAKQEAGTLFLHIAGKIDGNACILFIDSKPGGVGFIRNNLITSGGEEGAINNMGTTATAGLTFENGFLPDYAVRIYGAGTQGHINTYDFTTGVRTYAGDSGTVGGAASAFVSGARTFWGEVTPAQYATANLGTELALSLAAMGVPQGSQNVKVMAVLVNGGSDYASNQVLGNRSAVTTDIGNGINAINFQTEPGTQTLTFPVLNNDTDNDGEPNDIDTDDDGDGLLDTEETHTGTYVSPTNTGTNPLIADTDGDGGSDGDEVLYSYFGFLSNPNIANYVSMGVVGSFTTPPWQVNGPPETEMTTVDTGITDQYQWKLDYRFATLGAIEYKFAADHSYTHSWGDGANNITGLIQGTGFHTFSFNNATLARSLVRKVFPNVTAYLTAYGVTASSDPDADGVTSANEFTKNSDPTVADTDGDGVNDKDDVNPLAASRNIVFKVNMSVQTTMGLFNPATDTVVVDFFNGLVGNLADLALTPAGGGVWTGTLTAFEGPPGTSIGEFKFKSSHPGAPDGGYEGAINNRTLVLGPVDVTQTVDVYFNDVTTPPGGGYSTWATANAGGQAPNLDYDQDGMANGIEYFMGQTGSTFTPNPQVVAGTITWPHSAAATGVTWRVWSSENLSSWTDVTASAVDSDGTLKYTVPTGSPKRFVRLEVVA